MAYDNKTKYNVIEEICNGKSSGDIQREHNISKNIAMKWLRSFVENGPFDDKELAPKETAKFEKLREVARKRELEMRLHGSSTSESYEWLLAYDPNLLEWKEYA